MRIPKSCLSVRLYPEKRNHPGFININPTLVIDASIYISSTLVIDTSMERSLRVLYLEKSLTLFSFKKNAYLSVSAFFYKQFLAYTVHID